MTNIRTDLGNKFQSIVYNFKWSDYVFLLNGIISRYSIFIPIIGYIILFNDYVFEKLTFTKISEQSAYLGLTSVSRMHLIYYGLIFTAFANILYKCFRPHTHKLGTNQFDYVKTALENFTLLEYIMLHEEIQREGHYTTYGKNYTEEWNEFRRKSVPHTKSKNNSSGNWEYAKKYHEHLLRNILMESFFRYDQTKRKRLILCISIAIIGYMFLIIPSIDLFLKISISVIGIQ